jgi:hypothetical protein
MSVFNATVWVNTLLLPLPSLMNIERDKMIRHEQNKGPVKLVMAF